MNNTTVWWTPGHYILNGVGLLQGLFGGVNNLLLLSTILYQRELRGKKENVVIFTVALADCLHGCGQVATFVTFLYGLLSYSAMQPVFRQECLLTAVPAFSIFTLTMQATMLVLQSTDRLLAVSKPLYYFGTTVSLPWRMCLAGFMYSLLQTVLLVWLSLDATDKTVFINQFCFPLTALKPAVFAYWNTSHVVLGTLSVVLFGIVLLLYRRHMNTVAPDTERQLQEHLASQRRVTMSMGLSCAATLALFVAPRIINLIFISLIKSTPAHMILQGIAYLTYNCNPILNFFIYMKRHENIHKGFKLMLKCKQLSLNQAYNQRVKKESVSGKENEGKFDSNVVGRRSGLPSNTGTAKGRGSVRVDAKHLLVRYSIRNAEPCSIEDT